MPPNVEQTHILLNACRRNYSCKITHRSKLIFSFSLSRGTQRQRTPRSTGSTLLKLSAGVPFNNSCNPEEWASLQLTYRRLKKNTDISQLQQQDLIQYSFYKSTSFSVRKPLLEFQSNNKKSMCITTKGKSEKTAKAI